MGITNKAISTKFLNIIIRTNHGHTEIVMLYGDLRSSVTCGTTSCSNDSFASLMHRTINCWIKACGMLFHSCTNVSCSSCSVSGGFWRWWTRLPSSSHKCSIGDRSIMPANEEHGCDSGSESLDKHDTCDILHCHVESHDQIFAVAERAER
jgi:hypothetical protein